MMAPTRQAWLQCTINQCGIDRRRVNCDPSDYLGPAQKPASTARPWCSVSAIATGQPGQPLGNAKAGVRPTISRAWAATPWSTAWRRTCAPQDWYRCMVQSQEHGLGRDGLRIVPARGALRGPGCVLPNDGERLDAQSDRPDSITSTSACATPAMLRENRVCIVGVWDPNASRGASVVPTSLHRLRRPDRAMHPQLLADAELHEPWQRRPTTPASATVRRLANAVSSCPPPVCRRRCRPSQTPAGATSTTWSTAALGLGSTTRRSCRAGARSAGCEGIDQPSFADRMHRPNRLRCGQPLGDLHPLVVDPVLNGATPKPIGDVTVVEVA